MRRLGLLVACGLIVAGLAAEQIPPVGGADALVADLAARRENVMRALGPDAVLVLWSAPPRVYSADTNYEYRQESNLLYLTGLSDEPLALVLVPGARGPREFLFVPERNPARELWTGRIRPTQEFAAASGISQVFAQRGAESFEAFMRALLREPVTAADTGAAAAGTEATPSASRIRLFVLGPNLQAGADAASSGSRWLRDARTRLQERISFVDATPMLEGQREVKTAYEQQVLRRSVEISAAAHLEGMKVARPGRWEYEVEAAIEHWFLKSGALSWGYPSIVASGPNATTLHYLQSTRQMQPGDLLLVDAAGNYQGMTGDITRTYPVSRRFTPDQRLLYEAVLAAQEAGIDAARPGGSVEAITRAVRGSLGMSLVRLGLVTDRAAATGDSPQIDLWFPHGPVHGIGIDVHDPLGTLVPGAAFVIEPGLYIRDDVLPRLSRDGRNAEFVAAVAPAVARFQGLGVRIEDSFLMTAAGPENLSRQVPRAARDVERLVGSGR